MEAIAPLLFLYPVPGLLFPFFVEVPFHCQAELALALLVLCVLADHANHTLAVDDLALHANLLD